MKNKRTKWFLACAFVLIGIFILFGTCKSEEDPPVQKPTAEVVSVAILLNGNEVTEPVSAFKGSALDFKAHVEVKNNAATSVNWSVSGGKSTIAANGTLTIADDEADDAVLTITATSTADASKKATATVNVLADDAPYVVSVAINSPGNVTSVQQGQTLQLTAAVVVGNGAVNTVTWSLSSTDHAAGTGINATGLLTIASAELKPSVTVKATPVQAGFANLAVERIFAIETVMQAEFNITAVASDGGTFSVADKALSGTTVTVTIDSVASGFRVGSVTVVRDAEPPTPVNVITVTENEEYSFTMPAFNVRVTANFWPTNRVYNIYSGGVVDGVTPHNWGNGQSIDFETIPGRSGGNAIRFTAGTAVDWCGLSFEVEEGINFNTFDALSYWVKSPDGAVFRSGFGGDDQNALGWEVSFSGNSNTGIAAGAEWQRVIIPIPNRINVSSQKQAIFIIGLPGKTVHVDDIELIAVSRNVTGITIPSVTTVPPETSVSINSLIGHFKVDYSVDSTAVSLINGQVNLIKWFEGIDFTVGGSASKVGENIVTGAAGGSFTVSVSLGGQTSNTLTGSIVMPSSRIIEDFSDIPSGGIGGNW